MTANAKPLNVKSMFQGISEMMVRLNFSHSQAFFTGVRLDQSSRPDSVDNHVARSAAVWIFRLMALCSLQMVLLPSLFTSRILNALRSACGNAPSVEPVLPTPLAISVITIAATVLSQWELSKRFFFGALRASLGRIIRKHKPSSKGFALKARLSLNTQRACFI